MTETLNNSKSLELAPAELFIPLKVTLGNQTYRVRHRLRPPSADDWFAYDAALAMAIEELPARNFDREVGLHADLPAETLAEASYKLELRSVEAAALLWDRLALGVEGYSLPTAESFEEVPQACARGASAPEAHQPRAGTSGGHPPGAGVGSLAQQSWASRVPLAHKEAAVRALTLVAPANYPGGNISPSPVLALHGVAGTPAAGFPLQAERVAVILEAIVAGFAYPRLIHSFRLPSADDERVYRRLLAETLIVRGSRATRTLIPSRLPALCRLYDRLILSVAGYTLHGQPITDRQALVANMDAWHKRTAVQTLFGDATESPLTAATAGELHNE